MHVAVLCLLLAAGDLRYAALGDSFTIGTGSSPDEAFPARLTERLRAAGYGVELKNLGVNGYSTENLIDDELPDLSGFRPDLVTVAIGANDIVRGVSADDYRAHLRLIFRSLVDLGVAPQTIVALPQPDWARSPASVGFGDTDELRRQIVQFNAILKDEVTSIGGKYVDLWSLMEKLARPALLADDGLHPSAKAHDAWAAELYRQLTSGGGRRPALPPAPRPSPGAARGAPRR